MTLRLRKMSLKQWQKQTAEHERLLAKLHGWSPGGAAAELGISRQAVHYAIRRGDLEAVIVNDDKGKLVMFNIPDHSVQAFKAARRERSKAAAEGRLTLPPNVA